MAKFDFCFMVINFLWQVWVLNFEELQRRLKNICSYIKFLCLQEYFANRYYIPWSQIKNAIRYGKIKLIYLVFDWPWPLSLQGIPNARSCSRAKYFHEIGAIFHRAKAKIVRRRVSVSVSNWSSFETVGGSGQWMDGRWVDLAQLAWLLVWDIELITFTRPTTDFPLYFPEWQADVLSVN